MSRAFLMTLDRLAFMTVLVISRMIDSKRLDSTASRIGSNSMDLAPTVPLSPMFLFPCASSTATQL